MLQEKNVFGDAMAHDFGLALADQLALPLGEPDFQTDSEHRHILEAIPLAVYTTDVEGRITFFNEAAVRMAGRRPILGIDKWCVTWKLFWPDGTPLPHHECPMAIAINQKRIVRGVEAIAERPDGTRVPFAPHPTPLYDSAGQFIGGLNVLLDISKRKKAEQRLEFLAHHDALTGLPNRAMFSERLGHSVQSICGTGDGFAVIVIDLDHFNEINDTFGHVVGDEVIRLVATRLKLAAPECFLARKGGDEFLMIVPNVRSTGILSRLLTVLQDAVSEKIKISGQEMRTNFQAGVSFFPDNGASEIELVGNADAALAHAKKGARGAVQFFDADLEQRLELDKKIQRDLRLAIEARQLSVHYQPLCDAQRNILGFEALARWEHPDLGPVPPDRFIPLAETSGLILPLGRWVLESACRDAASWTNPLSVAVNLSPVQFQHEDIPALVKSVLTQTGLAASRLELEITESVFIDDKDRALATLVALQNLGVAIALDDFGTGYSSLSYLRDFPFSKIKIDRSFVSAIGTKVSAQAIVRAVIGLGHSMQMKITAEGIETEDQFNYLANEGCDVFQGYLMGKPTDLRRIRHLTSVPVG